MHSKLSTKIEIYINLDELCGAAFWMFKWPFSIAIDQVLSRGARI